MGTIALSGHTDTASVRLALTFDPLVTAVTVTRIDPGNVKTVLRAGQSVALTSGVGTIDDYEVPLDVAVTYHAVQLTPVGTETATSAGITIMSYGCTWLRDPALPGGNMRLDYVENLKETTRAARAGVFDVVDRASPVVVYAKRQNWTGDLTLWTYTDVERSTLESLLNRGAPLLLSTPPAYGIGNAYVHVGDVACARLDTVGFEPLRHWTLPLTQIDRSVVLATMPTEMHWGDVPDNYATWTSVITTEATWLDLLNAFPSN